MIAERLFSKPLALVFVGLFAACGGNVEVDSSGGGGTGGGATTTSSATGGTTGTGGNTGGTTGTGGNTGGSTGVGGFGGGACEGYDELSCLGAFPSCVPVYDDNCCPSCNPMGGCADCFNMQFHHCEENNNVCNPSCGIVPEWGCFGKQADCNINPGGSAELCTSVPGCTPAYCNLNQDCTTDPVCHPVFADMCVSLCNAIPPPCPNGTTAETNGSCYTGFCIEQQLCGFIK